VTRALEAAQRWARAARLRGGPTAPSAARTARRTKKAGRHFWLRAGLELAASARRSGASGRPRRARGATPELGSATVQALPKAPTSRGAHGGQLAHDGQVLLALLHGDGSLRAGWISRLVLGAVAGGHGRRALRVEEAAPRGGSHCTSATYRAHDTARILDAGFIALREALRVIEDLLPVVLDDALTET